MAKRKMRQQQPSSSRFKTICVFCSSSEGKRTSYHDAANALAQELVSRGIDLVYGAGGLGLMGLVSQAVHRGGRRVVGVIPKTMMTTPEIIGETAGEVITVAGMHQRKAEMARQSDAFIALPGGYGTLEELLEMITWAQLGIHRKPVGLLNVDGYYDSLLAFIDQAVEEGFVSPSAGRIIVHAPTAHDLMDKLEEYVPYYDRVASGLNWETRVVVKDAGAGSGTISVSADSSHTTMVPKVYPKDDEVVPKMEEEVSKIQGEGGSTEGSERMFAVCFLAKTEDSQRL